MSDTETFWIPLEAAEMYEARFVPGIFAEWASLLVDAADVAPGQAVLDVACGTGIVARTVADRLDGGGVVVGVDLNDAMLTVAGRVRPDLDWQLGDAQSLPFPPGTFDRVLCQMGLMFFPDRDRAVAEMARVAAPGGRVVVVVPAAIGDQPAYGPFVDVCAAEAGQEARSLLDTYWSCGDPAGLRALFTGAGLEVVEQRSHVGTARFESADGLVATEVEGSPLASRIDEDTYRRIKVGARRVLAEFTAADGTVHAPLRGEVVVGVNP